MEFYDAHVAAQAALENADANKKGKKSMKKDPEAPKRPSSSYIYFATEKRDEVRKNSPDASMTEVSKILGEMWNKLGKGKRGKNGSKKYDDLAASDKLRYTAEKTVYDEMIAKRNAESEQVKIDCLNKDREEAMKLMNTFKITSSTITNETTDGSAKLLTSDIKGAASANTDTKKIKKKKDPNAPKKNPSAYIFFCSENRGKVKAELPEGAKQPEILTEMGRQWKELSEDNKEKYVQMASKDKDRYLKDMEMYKAQKKD